MQNFEQELQLNRQRVTSDPTSISAHQALAKSAYLNGLYIESVDSWVSSLMYSVFEHCSKLKNQIPQNMLPFPTMSQDMMGMLGMPNNQSAFDVSILNDKNYRQEIISQFFSQAIHLGQAILAYNQNLQKEVASLVVDSTPHLTLQQGLQAVKNEMEFYKARLITSNAHEISQLLGDDYEPIEHKFDFNNFFVYYASRFTADSINWDQMIDALSD